MLVIVCFFSMLSLPCISFFFFFNDTATTEIYTLSLHDALPISHMNEGRGANLQAVGLPSSVADDVEPRSEEHTSELQSQSNLVCRLLLEKKKKKKKTAKYVKQYKETEVATIQPATHRDSGSTYE